MTSPDSTVTVEDLLTHAGWARRLAARLTAGDGTADDLVQEAWIAAARHPPSSDRPLKPWLGVVLRNLFLKRRLGETRREARQSLAGAAAESLSPEALFEKFEVQRLLAELVAALAEPYRQTLILRFFEDLSAADIARQLGVPAGTVRWRLKVALDELRGRIAERQGHDQRAQWLTALFPVADERPRLWPWAIGLASVSVVVVITVVAGSRGRHTAPSGEAPPALTSAAASAPAPPGASGDRTHLLAAAGGVDLTSCQTDVKRLRAESAAAELARRQRLSPTELFALGTANPAAEAALSPAIERILKGKRPTAPSHTLECRTWVCRIMLAETSDEQETDNWQPLQRDEELMERVAGMAFEVGRPTKDPLSGVGLDQTQVFIVLADPSGKRLPQPRSPEIPAVSTLPLPRTAEACAKELQSLRAQIGTAREETEGRLRPDERFEKSAPAPQLTRELRANIVSTLAGTDTSRLALECRGLVCRGHWEDAPKEWYNQFYGEAWYRKRVDGMMVGDDVYFVIAPGPRADALEFLRDLVKQFEATSALADCQARFSARGNLRVRLLLPKTGEPNDAGEVGRVSATYGETLAGTPIGKCVEAAIAGTILTAPLPTLPVGGAVHYRDFEFPRSATRRSQ
jgi:RNA polymerase sigma-70 factor (ECF subfamily)